jgi:cyclic pyranopterin phosphate synthase
MAWSLLSTFPIRTIIIVVFRASIELNWAIRVLMKEQLLTANNRDLLSGVDYMRISITDRCNQRCFYCMPHGDVQLFTHDEILRYEEILSIVEAAVQTGFRKFRITGGEPLVRKGVSEFIRRMVALKGVEEVVLTTNGVMLEDLAPSLFEAGLNRVNISLDTLNPLKFQKITQRDQFYRVRRGIDAARRAGLDPLKINMVVIRGINDDEVERFGRWAVQENLLVRFIEFMPIGYRQRWEADKFVSIDEIRWRLEQVMDLYPLRRRASDGPAERYRVGGGRGEIGLIGAVSHHFCHRCNRLRLTPEGKLRPCLLRDEEIDIRIPLRSGCEQDGLIDLIQKAVGAKVHRCAPDRQGFQSAQRSMSRIGG